MKQLDLKFWQKVRPATKITLLILASFAVPTKFEAQRNAVNNTSYKLIEYVIGQDTIVQDSHLRSINNKIKMGRITSRDSMKFVNKIRNQKLNLYKNTINKIAKKRFVESLSQKDWKVLVHITDKAIRNIIESIEYENEHPPDFFDTKINLIEKYIPEEPYHSFSSPFKISDNKYVIYHVKYKGPLAAFDEFIVYEIASDESFKIVKFIPLSIS